MKLVTTTLLVTALFSFNALAERQSGRQSDRIEQSQTYSMNNQLSSNPTAAGNTQMENQYNPTVQDKAGARHMRREAGRKL